MNSNEPVVATDDHPLAPLVARMVGDEKHATSAYGTLHAMHALYSAVLRVDPTQPMSPDRDRFLLSKGHGPMAYFAALAQRGFFPMEWLDTFLRFDGQLGAHPDRQLVPGVEISSGSLGHGLPMAVGVALALRARASLGSPERSGSAAVERNAVPPPRVFCLVGDGELDEGSNHEAIAFAGRAGLSRLTVLVIDNQSASHGWPGGIEARFAVEGWSTTVVDGTDEAALIAALDEPVSSRPRVVIARVERKGA